MVAVMLANGDNHANLANRANPDGDAGGVVG
jgi:hypothetical protein